jgi:ferric-dicitrate binding protein FerR (iron transport regulator)
LRALCLTLPLILVLWACKKEPVEPGLATIIQSQGQVSVQHGAEQRAGAVGQAIYKGDVLTTGPASTARVRYVNGVEVRVSENSRFRVDGVPGALTLELEEGQIISTAPADAGTGLKVRGRFGQAEIVTAAEVVFDLRSEKPKLTLEYGEITVVDPSGQAVPITVAEEVEFNLSKPKPPAPPVAETEEIVFFLKPLSGKARVRDAQQTTFAEVSTDQTRQLGPGAEFDIPAQAAARLSSSELQVNLAGDTAGTITSASRQGEQKSYALQLSRGQAQLQFAPGQHTLKLKDAKGELELKVTEQTAISVSNPREGAAVTVLAGQLELVADGKSTVLKAGEGLNRAEAAPQAAVEPAPALLLPADAKARVFSDGVPLAGIQVPEAGGAPLRVEVAGEPSFREPLFAGRVGQRWVRVTPPTKGELHWRFLSQDGAPRAQGSARFQPDRGLSSLSAKSPKAEVLETGLKAAIYFQGAVPSLHFSFDAREGARSYRIRIYRASNPQTPLLERVASRTQYTLEPGALGEGNYLWYVAALGPSGEELSGGRMNKLELVYDNARRGLAVSRPRPSERPGPNGVPLEGVAPIGSKLFVNGQAISLDAKGRFSQRLPPSQVLVFRLISDQGEAYWVRTLRSGDR